LPPEDGEIPFAPCGVPDNFQSYCPARVWRTTICASRRNRAPIHLVMRCR